MILKTVGLNKYFAGIKAVHNINMEIKKGEISCIIGPNGAGKSTLFNVMTGHLRADSGQIFFEGEDITQYLPHTICRRGIGRSFQKTNIFPRFTVFENVQQAILAGGGKSLDFFHSFRRQVVHETNEILSMIGLSNQSDKICGTLALGDKKLVEFGIALANQPSLLLLDEPTAGMSPGEATSIMDTVTKLAQKNGVTLVFIEHDMKIVFDFAEKIRVMSMGKLIAEGTPQDIKKNKKVQRIYLGEGE